MLSQRQLTILSVLYDVKDDYIAATRIASECSISVRTVKSEIEVLKGRLVNSGVTLVSLPSKGYKLNIDDSEKIEKYMIDCRHQLDLEHSMNDQPIRLKFIILMLLNNPHYVKKKKIQSTLNVSDSTLYLDLKEVKKIIARYDLELMYKSGSGYCILGKEKDKRSCLAYEDVYSLTLDSNAAFTADLKKINHIKEILVEIFLKNEYKISEVLFESLIMHLLLTLQRIEKGYLIEDTYEQRGCDDKEYQIAQDIFNQCIKHSEYNLQYEIAFLAINLRGKRDYVDYKSVSDEIITFIAESLVKIHSEFGVDFSRSIDLKVVLALHFVPLLSRMQNNMQLKNLLLKEIKQSFPFAFDLAQYFGLLIYEKYHIRISEDEAAYFTLYFNYGLENIVLNSDGKKVLVISSLKQSETILLRQKIYQWFEKQILQLDFINPSDLQRVEIGEYDVLFTTEKVDAITRGAAVSINLFPNEKDFAKMNLAINGYDSIDAILQCFTPELFYVGSARNRLEIVQRLIDMSTDYFNLPPKFAQLILERESLSSSYFANQVAMPHPLYPFSPQTFIAVAILDESIDWEENHPVKLVLLVSTEMNNPKAFQIWPYLSSLVCSRDLVEQVLKDHSYEHFISVLKASLLDKF